VTPWTIDEPSLRIRRFVVGPYENNVYVVACPRTGEAVLVDAAADADRIVAECADVTVRQVLTTHGHFDHVGAALEVTERLGVPFRLHPADVHPEICDLPIDQPLTDGEVVVIGDVEVAVLHTPGHTPGSSVFAVGDHLLTGDTLFPGGPGATRWDYSSFDTIIGSIRERLFTRADHVSVHPGHGDPTTIGSERPSLDEWVARGW